MCDESFIEFVCDTLKECGEIGNRKMFGEYCIYIDKKPCFLVCDNQVFVKKHKELEDLLKNSDVGFPYKGAKECYILDIDNESLSVEVGLILKEIVEIPKKRKK